MHLQNEAVAQLVELLSRRVDQTREAAALKKLEGDLEFAASLAAGGWVLVAVGSKINRAVAAFGIMGRHNIIKMA
jgi:chorismate mutase